MNETPQEIDSMFPALDAAQIERLCSFGARLQAQPGELIFDVGNTNHGVFVVLRGSIEIVGVSKGKADTLRVMGPGTFTGEKSINSRDGAAWCGARHSKPVNYWKSTGRRCAASCKAMPPLVRFFCGHSCCAGST